MLWLTLYAILSQKPLPIPDVQPRQGLAAHFTIYRWPNAYEGAYKCIATCYEPNRDGGVFAGRIEFDDPDPTRCINRIIEKSKTQCPRKGW